MGCDIHLHTEVKIGGKWYHYGNPNCDRRYDVFAKMGNVRNPGNVKSLSNNRGLPDDVSFLTRFMHIEYGTNGHSTSWLSAEEITELANYIDKDLRLLGKYGLLWWCFDNFGCLFGNPWEGFWEYRNDPGENPKGVEDVRFVFWFDN